MNYKFLVFCLSLSLIAPIFCKTNEENFEDFLLIIECHKGINRALADHFDTIETIAKKDTEATEEEVNKLFQTCVLAEHYNNKLLQHKSQKTDIPVNSHESACKIEIEKLLVLLEKLKQQSKGC